MLPFPTQTAREPAAVAAGRPTSYLAFFLVLRMGDYGQVITGQLAGLISFDPSGCARGNDLDCDIYRLDGTLVTHQVYIPATYVGEAFACP